MIAMLSMWNKISHHASIKLAKKNLIMTYHICTVSCKAIYAFSLWMYVHTYYNYIQHGKAMCVYIYMCIIYI